MNENKLNQLEIDILDKMCLDNEEDKKFKELYKKDNNKMKDHIKNESLTFEKYIREEEIKKEDNFIPNNRLPNRADEKYTRIESYEDYEFTHCIAYEMAIRNENVKKLTLALEKLNSLSFDIFSNFSSELSSENKIINFKNLINIMMSHSNTLNVNNPQKAISEIFYKFSTDLDNNHLQTIKEKFIQIINEDKKDYFISIMRNYQDSNIKLLLLKYKENDLEELFNKANFEEQLHLIELLKNSIQDKLAFEYFVVDEKKSITPENIEEFIPKDTNYEPSPEINNHINTIFTDPNYKEKYIHEERSGYIAYQGTYENDNSFTINKVIPNFAQPLRMFNTMDISINPSLPLNDILSFVKKIKEEYDTKCDFKSFFELSLENLIVDSDTKNTIDNATSYNKDKWADLFYIYDYYQFYFSEGNKINKGKNENGKANKEDDSTTVAKEISLQLSFYHILGQKEPLDFSAFADINNYESAYNNYESAYNNYESAYNKYETNLFYKIEETKEYEKYTKLRKKEDRVKEKTINFYMTAHHIKTDYYQKMKKLIEGNSPEYKKLIDGRNHEKNSFIDGKNSASSKL